MSKYYKAEDVENMIINIAPDGEVFELGLGALENLPTIEVSEDCISRSELIERFKELIVRANSPYLKRGIRWAIGYTQSAPSVVPRLDKEDLEDIKEHISESYIEGYMDGKAEGEWITHYETYEDSGEIVAYGVECPFCGRWEENKEPFCNCGAKMKV